QRPAAKSVEDRSGAVLLEEAGYGADAEEVVFDFVLLVRRVEPVVGESEAHQDGRDAEVRGEIADDRDGASGANEDSLLAEDFAEGAGGGPDRGGGGVDAHARRRGGRSGSRGGRD